MYQESLNSYPIYNQSQNNSQKSSFIRINNSENVRFY